MAFTKDGKKKSSKFRASRYDREHSDSGSGSESKPKPKGESPEKAAEEEAGGGARAKANRMNAVHEGNPEAHGFGESTHGEHKEPEGDESEMAPMSGEPDGDEAGGGMDEAQPEMGEGGEPDHSEIQQIAAEHGPAHSVNMVHDHASGMSHVHSIHADGHEHHADIHHPDHVKHAHKHATHAAGVAEDKPMYEGGEGHGEEEDSYSEPL